MNGVLADKISMYLLGELEKLVMLLIIFSIFGYGAEIVIIMTVMLMLRS